MGLDGVELIMDIENEFGIEIADHDIDRLESVGATLGQNLPLPLDASP